MIRVIGLVLVLVWVWSLAESILTPRDQVRGLPKVAWIVLIVLLGPVGGLAWLTLGRPRASASLPTGAPGAHPGQHGGRAPRPPRRPIRGPDDDPDFLREL